MDIKHVFWTTDAVPPSMLRGSCLQVLENIAFSRLSISSSRKLEYLEAISKTNCQSMLTVHGSMAWLLLFVCTKPGSGVSTKSQLGLDDVHVIEYLAKLDWVVVGGLVPREGFLIDRIWIDLRVGIEAPSDYRSPNRSPKCNESRAENQHSGWANASCRGSTIIILVLLVLSNVYNV